MHATYNIRDSFGKEVLGCRNGVHGLNLKWGIEPGSNGSFCPGATSEQGTDQKAISFCGSISLKCEFILIFAVFDLHQLTAGHYCTVIMKNSCPAHHDWRMPVLMSVAIIYSACFNAPLVHLFLSRTTLVRNNASVMVFIEIDGLTGQLCCEEYIKYFAAEQCASRCALPRVHFTFVSSVSCGNKSLREFRQEMSWLQHLQIIGKDGPRREFTCAHHHS